LCILGPPRDWRRRDGIPRQSWLRTVEDNVRPLSFGLATARRRALDRSAWRLLLETARSTWHAPERERVTSPSGCLPPARSQTAGSNFIYNIYDGLDTVITSATADCFVAELRSVETTERRQKMTTHHTCLQPSPSLSYDVSRPSMRFTLRNHGDTRRYSD